MAVQLTSLLTFSAILVPFLKYPRQERLHLYDSCKTLAFKHYETDLAHCTKELAHELPLGRIMFTRPWLGMVGLVLAAGIWQYMTFLLQRWLSARLSIVESKTGLDQDVAITE